uniref:Uncharacterized protein n=1 Tax=Eptatretus burgeri TaxID=7764 RepID=A0A8C4NJU9_EPTBU
MLCYNHEGGGEEPQLNQVLTGTLSSKASYFGTMPKEITANRGLVRTGVPNSATPGFCEELRHAISHHATGVYSVREAQERSFRNGKVNFGAQEREIEGVGNTKVAVHRSGASLAGHDHVTFMDSARHERPPSKSGVSGQSGQGLVLTAGKTAMSGRCRESVLRTEEPPEGGQPLRQTYRPRMAVSDGVSPKAIQTVITQALRQADAEFLGPPYDGLLIFRYEGGASPPGSPGSLSPCASFSANRTWTP